MRQHPRQGFTLAELMVAVSIIALLMAIVMPVWARSREEAKLTTCVQNLRNIGVAIQAYQNDNPQAGLVVLSWSIVVPTYLARVPTCPSSGVSTQTSSAGYWLWSATQNGVNYTFVTCEGSHAALIPSRSSQYQGPCWSPRCGVNDGRSGQWIF